MIRLIVEIPKALEILNLVETEDERMDLLKKDADGWLFEMTIRDVDTHPLETPDNYIYLVKYGKSQDAYYNVYVDENETEELKRAAIKIEIDDEE